MPPPDFDAPARTAVASPVARPAPPFDLEAVVGGKFERVSLERFSGGWLVILFYPLDFTFVCPTELHAFSDRIGEFATRHASVVGVSVDSVNAHLAWLAQPRREGGIAGVAFPLLSDLRRTTARDYGVLSDEGVALRGLFLVDPDGIVQHAVVNNLSVGRSVDETLRVLDAFRFTREHGEVCPADWHEGGATMVADPEQAREYFESAHQGANA